MFYAPINNINAERLAKAHRRLQEKSQDPLEKDKRKKCAMLLERCLEKGNFSLLEKEYPTKLGENKYTLTKKDVLSINVKMEDC